MHFCPDCAQPCTCRGDAGDAENKNAAKDCVHDCEDAQELDEDFDELNAHGDGAHR
jgi:hypothetical protein